MEFGADGRRPVGGPPAGLKRRRGHHPVGSVGPAAVVVLAEVLDDDLRLSQAGEHLDGEQLVTDTAVEALDERVLPRAAGLDERGAVPAEATLVA